MTGRASEVKPKHITGREEDGGNTAASTAGWRFVKTNKKSLEICLISAVSHFGQYFDFKMKYLHRSKKKDPNVFGLLPHGDPSNRSHLSAFVSPYTLPDLAFNVFEGPGLPVWSSLVLGTSKEVISS